MAHVTLLVPFDPIGKLNPSNASELPLRLAYLAATTRSLGHRVTVIDGVGEGFGHRWDHGEGFHLHGLDIPALVARVPEGTDVVGVSMMFSQTWPPVRALLRALRRRLPRARIVVGGEGVTGIADLVVRDGEVDAVVTGEGEEPWTLLLAALEAGEGIDGIPNVVTPGHAVDRARRIVTRRSEIRGLDELPFPDWSDIPLSAYWGDRKGHGPRSETRYLPTVASRGCPYKCRFCTAPGTWGNQRYRSVQNVLAELGEFSARHDVSYFIFHDLSMTNHIRWFEAFVDGLNAQGPRIHWNVPAGVRASRLSLDLLRRAKASGLNHLQIAPETGSPAVLEWIDKKLSLDTVFETVRNAKQAGLPVSAYIIVGHPVETLDDFVLTLRFLSELARLGVDEIAVSAFTALPGSPHFEQMRREGRIEFSDAFFSTLAQGDLSFQVSNSPYFDGREVQAMRLQALAWFYARAFTARKGDLFRMLARVVTDDQQTKLDRVLRYELLSVIRGFAPILSRASFGVLAQVALRYLAGRDGEARRAAL